MNDSIHPLGLTAALIFAAGIATACSDTAAPTPVLPQPAATASDTSSQSSVVGTVPAGPTKDIQPDTSAAKSDISKTQQSNNMPMPGQANDHSTLAPNASQKADTKTP
jgi:hypothetical protein